MKVLHLIKTEVGAIWACRQIEVLRELGLDITVILPSDSNGLASRYKAAGAKIIVASIDVPFKKMWTLPSVLNTIRNIIEEVKPDLIHSHFVGTTYMMRLALGKNHPIPRIFQVPGPLHLERGPYRYIDKLLSGPNDHWIGSCKWTFKKYLDMGIPNERVHYAVYGTDVDFLKPHIGGKLRKELDISYEVPLVGMVAFMYSPKRYLGQFKGIKGHEDFIKSIQIVKKQMPNIKAVIIGGPWGNAQHYEIHLKKMARKLCGESIIFMGFRTDVPELYPDFNVVAHPSLSENLGGAGESLLMEVPTIATNVGGIPDIVKDGETGWLIPKKSPNILAIAIIEAILDDSEAKRRARKGRELVLEKCHVRKTTGEILGIYNRILNNKIVNYKR